jgi:hypothetical protein
MPGAGCLGRDRHLASTLPNTVRLSWLSFGAVVHLATEVAIGLAADIRVLNWQGHGTDFEASGEDLGET